MFTEVEDGIHWIESVKRFGDKLDLSRMEIACEILGHPERELNVIHIAGTNGKGSTVAYLKHILLEHGYNVGTYTSPYIVRFNERINTNYNDITNELKTIPYFSEYLIFADLEVMYQFQNIKLIDINFTNIDIRKLKLKKYDSRGTNKINYWTQYVNNENNGYTLLPSTGGNLHHGKKQSLVNNDTPFSDNSFALEEQNNFRIIWEDEFINNTYSGKTFFSPEEYNRTIGNFYNLSSNNKKVFDLIATFNPQMLEDFETHFLNFASEKVNLNYSDKSFSLTKYGKFQEVLRDIVNLSYDKNNDSDNIDSQIQNLKIKQSEKLKTFTTSLLSNNDLINITIGNPKELDPHVVNGFIDFNKTNRFKYNPYDDSKFNQDYVDLYLGIEPEAGCYKSFFIDNDVEFSEANVLMFRPIVYMYGGFKKLGLSIRIEKL